MKANYYLTLFIIASLIFPTNYVLAAPSGGKVARGNASISQKDKHTQINQSSNRAVINWNKFDIAKNESVNHKMPNSKAAALHRVTGGDISKISGELSSNGNIFLVNPSGVIINKGAKINTNSFVATTSDISNDDFMGGRYNFQAPTNTKAAIINEGNISVSEKGYAALVAPTVRIVG